MELSEKDYAKAFNQGYLLKEHDPELLETILKGEVGDSEYLKAVIAGKDQFEKENDRSPAFLKSDRLSSLGKNDNQSKEKDKNDLGHDDR